MTGDEQKKLDEAIASFRSIVASDGGDVRLESYSADTGVVTIEYKVGTNDECPGCVITPGDLSIFVKEAIVSRGLRVEEVAVRTR